METAIENKSGSTNYQKTVCSFSAQREIPLKKKKALLMVGSILILVAYI